MDSIQTTIESFLNQLPSNNDNTIKTYFKSLGYLTKFLPEIELSSGSPVEVLSDLRQLDEFPAWLNRQDLSGNSRALIYTVVSAYVDYLIRDDILPDVNYAAHNRFKYRLSQAVKRSKETRQLALKLPTQEIVDALIEAAKAPPAIPKNATAKTRQRTTLIWLRNQAIVLMLQSSGVRVGELVGLVRRNLDLENCTGEIIDGKGDKDRFFQYSPAAAKVLQTYLNRRQDETAAPSYLGDIPVFCRHDKRAGENKRLPTTTRSIERIIEDLSKQAGLSDRFHMTPHKLRHFFGSQFLRKTNDLAMTQDFMGHSSPTTTRIYADPSTEDMMKAHKEVFGSE